MEENDNDKTEQATPFKLERSRKKGVVARGVDLGFLAGTMTLLAYVSIAGPQLGDALSHMARESLTAGPELAGGRYALLVASASITSIVVKPLLVLLGLVFFGVLLCEVLQTGIVFSAQPLSPDFSRLSPANGFKRVFSVRALIEAGKNILKVLVYFILAILVVRATLQANVETISDARSLSSQLQFSATRLLAAFVLGAILFAVLDQLIVRNAFSRRMRMSRRELRREARDREGEPRLKQKRKQLHRELAKASQSLRNLRKADVLITNPQHIALALRYDPKTMLAPTVVSIGIDHLAQRLKRMAFLYGIPIIENRALARALYRKGVLNSTIPQECFQPVAGVYNTIRAWAQAKNAERADV